MNAPIIKPYYDEFERETLGDAQFVERVTARIGFYAGFTCASQAALEGTQIGTSEAFATCCRELEVLTTSLQALKAMLTPPTP